MDIEKANALLEKFKYGISHDPKSGLNDVLAYQDVIGRSSMTEIADFEESMDRHERKHFLWVNFLTLSQDLAMEILKKTTVQRMSDRVDREI